MIVYSGIKKYIRGHYFDFKNKYGMQSVYAIGVTALGILLFSGGYIARQYYVQQRETKAFNGFREVSKSFQDTQLLVKDLTDQEVVLSHWNDLEHILGEIYNQNKGSYLAPYFLMYRAQVRLEKGDTVDQVYQDVDAALRLIPFDTPLYNLFLLKRIKMGLDSENEFVREVSLKDLQELADAPDRHMYEEAVYLLGLYQINNGQLAEAQATWKKLQEDELKSVGYSVNSPWKKAVADKVKPVV
jgi:hypothetical protein